MEKDELGKLKFDKLFHMKLGSKNEHIVHNKEHGITIRTTTVKMNGKKKATRLYYLEGDEREFKTDSALLQAIDEKEKE
jgi:hypothetical protein